MRELRFTHNILLENSDSLKMILREIRREDLLTYEEEAELSARIRRGDRRAAEKMVRSNLRFVVSVAKQYQGQGLELTELINEGAIGLIRAVDKYDSYLGYRFVSYAVWWIRQHIEKAIDEQGRLVRLPANVVSKIRKVDGFTYRFYTEEERMPSADEVAEELNISPQDAELCLGLSNCFSDPHDHYSLDDPIDVLDERFHYFKRNALDDEENKLLTDVLDANMHDSEPIDFKSLDYHISQCFNRLEPRDKKIISMFYGIGCREMTLEEIGDKLYLTRERVRQIKQNTIEKMRKNRFQRILRQYLG